MSDEHQITMPKLGESIVSATIVQWLKKEGDEVKLDEPLLEVSTDKLNSEIPSPVSGVITKIRAEVDEELEVGKLLCLIRTADEMPSKEDVTVQNEDRSDYFTPAVLRLAKEKGISLAKLSTIEGTGEGGRVTKKDIENFGAENEKTPCQNQGIERIKLTGVRKATADNMVRSFYEAPHATLVSEVDVTNIIKKIKNEKEAFFAKWGVKLTITSYMAKAIAVAAKEYPFINSSVEGDTIAVKRFINLGLAVSVDQSVLVPVINNCQSLDIVEIAKSISELSSKARKGTLEIDEMQNGTITMTNFGMAGVHMGVPIIRHPEVAIVGIGAIHKKVVATDDDQFGIRSMVHISLTFDHRVLDGMYGCGFLNALKKCLEIDFVDF